MAFGEWDDTYSVNVKEIDEQHKKLVDMINRLHSSMNDGTASSIVSEILTGMAAYTDYHFCTEEEYFEKFDLREKDIHIAEHINFKNKVKEFTEKYEQNPMALTIEVMYFLSDWLKKHIQGTDKNYTTLFNNHGLT